MLGETINRRESMIAAGLGLTSAFAWGALSSPATAEEAAAPRRRAIRIANLSDVHVQPELRAGEGLKACLHHVQQLADKPELIINGGDSVWDSYDADDARTKLQWELWNSVLKNECSLPFHSCIGNHDVWGWAKSKSHTSGREPLWGKKRAIEMLRLEERYYALAQAGWRFIFLDSTQPVPCDEGYTAHLDEEQLDWLTRTLRDTPAETPVMIVSHIPILSATPFVLQEPNKGNYEINGSWVHTDFVKLKDLFARHPNVKLCVSGHMHLVDRVDYNGVTYLCSGAVSGNWWEGRHVDCDEGYAVIDLYNDGTFDHQYVKYGWQAKPEQPKAASGIQRRPLVPSVA